MIPVSEPVIEPEDLASVTEAIRAGWVSSAGPALDAFEQRWAQYCGRAYGIAVSSGTAALQVAVASLDLAPGDEVILPTFTIISCAIAVVAAGGVPVLVDSDPVTWGLDPGALEAKITPRTRAIMPVHIYGHPVDMDPVLALADEHGLSVIEDAAEAHGAEYFHDRTTWVRCGSMGTMSCFSFYANKLITTGEGGMVVTDDAALASRLRSLRNLCFQPERRFHHESLGFNFRMTNMQAALGLPQIGRMDQIVARKRRLGKAYTDGLQGVSGLQLPAEASWARSVWWMYGMIVEEDTGLDGTTLAAALRERGVDTRPFFLGMHRQPALRRRGWFEGERYPVADRMASQGLYLPSGLGLEEVQLDEVVSAVKAVLA